MMVRVPCLPLVLAFCGLYLWLFEATAAATEAQAETLQLLGRSQGEEQNVLIDEADWRWLRLRHELRLGTSSPDYPPFDISASGRDYEGLTADYAGLIAQLLDTRISVLRYPSRAAALAALSAGEIDLLGSSNRFEVETAGVVLSTTYSVDQSVLISRIGEPYAVQTLDGRKLAVGYNSMPLSVIEARYPGAAIRRYASEEHAMAAVAFGQADAMLSNVSVAQYLIQQNYSNSVRIAQMTKPEAIGHGFALRQEDARLRRIINAALAAIPQEQHQSIQTRWSGGLSLNNGDLKLSAAERRWLERNPVVRVAVESGQAPLSYVDADGHYRGSTADLLTLIELRTGLKFDIQRKKGIGELLEAVRSGEADMLADTSPDIEREEYLRFSRPYLVNPFVLVSRKQAAQLDGLASLNGRTLAIPEGHTLIGEVSRAYPQIKLLQTGSALEGFTLVRDGQADAAVHAMSGANYYIRRMYDEQLRISTTIDLRPSLAAFGMLRSETELQGILDKVLIDIAPDEFNALNNRWRTNAVVSSQSWRDYRELISQIIAVAVLLLLVSLVWNFYLRRQVKQRLLAKQRLADQLHFMEALINGTPHPIYVRDRDGRMLTCNDSYLRAFAVEREAVIGRPLDDGLLAEADPMGQVAAYLDDYREVMDKGQALIEDRVLRIGERTLTIYHWLLPYKDSQGELQGIIGGWLDISERQALVDELQSARERADEASRAKTTFLATMSHEIRTPMSAILGMLELALKRADQGRLDRQAIEVAYDSARGLLALIGDILDIARIESGRLGLAPERANLRVLVESVARVFDGQARQKSLGLLLDIDAAVSRDVLIDPLRFKQVLSNLVSNAIKFTEAGQVTIRIHGQLIDEERIAVQLLVDDTGIGISATDQEHLFQPFAQVRQNGLSGRNGAGLGLVICRSLCEMMGGRLTLSSAPAQGTRVVVELNLATLEPASPDSQATSEVLPTVTNHLRVLVVDDHTANRLLLCQQLAFYGHQISEAKDGVEGLQVWRNGRFDLVISDCNMPLMSGYALTHAIRCEEQARGLPPCNIFGYTANAQPDERQRCLDSGMDDCLFKPISLAVLGERISDIRAIDSAVEAAKTSADVFDSSTLNTLTGGDPSLARRLFDELLSSTTEDLQTLRELAVSAECGPLAELAHRIKGAARIVKAERLVQCCEILESVCLQESSAAHFDVAIQALAAEMQSLLEALEQQGATASRGTL